MHRGFHYLEKLRSPVGLRCRLPAATSFDSFKVPQREMSNCP